LLMCIRFSKVVAAIILQSCVVLKTTTVKLEKGEQK